MGRFFQKPAGRALSLLSAIAAVGCLAATCSADRRLEWVETPKHTYILLPPTLITDGTVHIASWSPTGAHLMVAASHQVTTVDQLLHLRVNPFDADAGTTMLLDYDRSSQHVRKLWESDDTGQSVVNIAWLEHSTTAYIVVQQHQKTDTTVTDVYGLMSLDVASGRFEWIPGMERLPKMPDVIPSPTQPMALALFDDVPEPVVSAQGAVAVASGDARALTPVAAAPGAPPAIPTYRPMGSWVFPGANNFWTIGAGGAVIHRIRTGPAPWAGVEWGADGTKWYFATQNRKSKVTVTQQLEDDGQLTTVTASLYVAPPPPKSELWIHTKPMVAKQRKAKRGFNNVWLSSPIETWHPDVLVTPNGTRSDLSPADNAVFYIEGGVAKVRTVEVLTEDQKAEMQKAIKAEAINDAKQAALGLLMYSNDMDDNLPGLGDLDALDPYLKDASLLDNFNYTPPGDLNLLHIGSPAETIIGYIDGPGGRAVAYSDGHVKWQNNP